MWGGCKSKSLPWWGYGYFLEPHILNETDFGSKREGTKSILKILNTVLPGKTNSHATIDKLTIDGSELTEPNQIANALNNYFATVAPNLLQQEHQTKESYNNEPQEAESHFNFRKLSVDEVFKMLKTIDA